MYDLCIYYLLHIFNKEIYKNGAKKHNNHLKFRLGNGRTSKATKIKTVYIIFLTCFFRFRISFVDNTFPSTYIIMRFSLEKLKSSNRFMWIISFTFFK